MSRYPKGYTGPMSTAGGVRSTPTRPVRPTKPRTPTRPVRPTKPRTPTIGGTNIPHPRASASQQALDAQMLTINNQKSRKKPTSRNSRTSVGMAKGGMTKKKGK